MKNTIKILLIIITLCIIVIFGSYSIYKHNIETNINNINTVDNSKVSTQVIDSSSSSNEELNVEQEGFLEYNEELSLATQDLVNTKELVPNSSQALIYYSQLDSRWKNIQYSITGKSSQTIGSSGCGPTSAAMVVSTIKGIVYPNEIAQLYIDNGFRSANDGTYLSAFAWTAKYYGIDFQRTSSFDTMISLLKDNHLVIASCGNGLFTTGGHLIEIAGINSYNELIIHDPYLYTNKFESYGRSGKVKIEGTTVYCPIETFRTYANSSNFFAYKNTNVGKVVTPDDNVVIPTIIDTKIVVTSSKQGLNIRDNSSTSANIIGFLKEGSSVNIYENRSNWSRIGINQWVCSDYLKYSSTFNPYKVTVKVNSTLNIRKSANKTSRIVGSLRNGNQVTVYEKQNNWGRIGTNQWINLSYTTTNTNTTPIASTVGKTKVFKQATIVYTNKDLSGTKYNYISNTSIKILENVSSTIDKIKVIKTGRVGYVLVSSYK